MGHAVCIMFNLSMTEAATVRALAGSTDHRLVQGYGMPSPETIAQPDATPPLQHAAIPASGDPVSLAETLMRLHPGSLVWFGKRTGRWWAVTGPRESCTLLETRDVCEMGIALAASAGAGSAELVRPYILAVSSKGADRYE